MAIVKVRQPQEQTLEGPAALEFLKNQGIGYEKWDVGAVPAHLRTFAKLDEEAQRQLLDVWKADIARLMAENNYRTADVLAVSDETVPNLDSLLDRFRPEHYHTEDEVRFVVAGSGVFGIHLEEPHRVFEVEVSAGDLLKVPQGTWHWFDLLSDRRIQCVRLFQDTSGWTPYYRPAEVQAAS